MQQPIDFATIGIHADKALNETSALTAPIYQTSTYAASTAQEFVEMASQPLQPPCSPPSSPKNNSSNEAYNQA